MKVLSLTEPYATLIKNGIKTIETRSWKTNYRGKLYIHASSTKIPKEYKNNRELMELVDINCLNYGNIICSCELVDCIEMTDEFIETVKKNKNEYITGVYGVGRYAWILKNIRVLDKPIKAKGHLGIWNLQFDDFDVVLNNFEREYDRLMPLLELYYNVVKYKVPNLTRFVNAITMLEYCSREFDDANALNKTIQKHQGKIPKNGADFVDRVISLIENINDVYKLDLTDIEMISKNIKDARTYYVHYEPSGKKLTDDQLFRYVYFIEDLIILNIYLIVGFDINKFANISYNEFFYDIDDLK